MVHGPSPRGALRQPSAAALGEGEGHEIKRHEWISFDRLHTVQRVIQCVTQSWVTLQKTEQS